LSNEGIIFRLSLKEEVPDLKYFEIKFHSKVMKISCCSLNTALATYEELPRLLRPMTAAIRLEP